MRNTCVFHTEMMCVRYHNPAKLKWKGLSCNTTTNLARFFKESFFFLTNPRKVQIHQFSWDLPTNVYGSLYTLPTVDLVEVGPATLDLLIITLEQKTAQYLSIAILDTKLKFFFFWDKTDRFRRVESSSQVSVTSKRWYCDNHQLTKL